MLWRRSRTTWKLRRAIEALPASTRAAMLVGIDSQDIIVGAYTARSGGVCPMLAAHRAGGRSDGRAFARAWDAFTGAPRPRPAQRRELELLAALLQESLPGTVLAPLPGAGRDGNAPAAATGDDRHARRVPIGA